MREEERVTAAASFAVANAREARYGALLDAMQGALQRLLRARAPDGGALAVKIELAIAHEVWELSQGAVCGAAILRDARRLAGPLRHRSGQASIRGFDKLSR